MKMKNFLPGSVATFVLLVAASFAHGASITKANNADDLNLTSSWLGSVVPGAGDVAVWSTYLPAPVLLGADLSWLGINVYNPTGVVTISGSNTLTLGKGGITVNTLSSGLTIDPTTLSLGSGNQIWTVGASRTLTINPTNLTRVTGATVNLQGTGTVATSTLTNTNGILGPWASVSGAAATRYATVNSGTIGAYTAGTAAATGANVTDTTGTVNYDIATTSGAFGANASVNTLRFASGANGAISGALTANGLMVANTSAYNVTLSGDITIGSTNELVVTLGNGNLILNGVIKNNGVTASKLVLNTTYIGSLTLSGSNTFTGGVVVNNLSAGNNLILNNSNALGIGGALEIQDQRGNAEIVFNPKSGETTANYANEIKYNLNVGGATAGLSTRTANSTVTLNDITGNGGEGYLHFRVGGNSTLVLAEGIETTGFNSGVRLMGGTNQGTIEFQKGISSTGAIDFYTSTAGMNALFSTAVTQANSITNSNAYANTLGVTHATGTSTFSGPMALGTNTGASALNLASKESGARTTFSGTLSGAGDLRINDTYTRVGATTQVVNNNGVVELANSTGNTYTGNTTVYAGTLLISNSAGSATGTGSVSVRAGATLAGTGIIASGGSNGLTVLSDGTIAPGEGGIGELTINSGSTSGVAATFSSGAVFAFDLNATTLESDRLILSNGAANDFAFNGNTINFTILTGTISNGQQYILFSGTDSDNQFAGLTIDGSGYITAGLFIGTGLGAFEGNLQIVDNDIVLNVVPEPATFALLAFSLTTIFALRRRRV